MYSATYGEKELGWPPDCHVKCSVHGRKNRLHTSHVYSYLEKLSQYFGVGKIFQRKGKLGCKEFSVLYLLGDISQTELERILNVVEND